MKKLKQWEDINPDYLLDEKLLGEWQLMVKEIIGPFENKDQEKHLSLIKKQIATTTTIPEKFCLKDK